MGDSYHRKKKRNYCGVCAPLFVPIYCTVGEKNNYCAVCAPFFIDLEFYDATQKIWTTTPGPTFGSTIIFFIFSLTLKFHSKKWCTYSAVFFFTDGTMNWYKKWYTYSAVVFLSTVQCIGTKIVPNSCYILRSSFFFNGTVTHLSIQ